MAYTRDGSESRITKRLESLIGVYDMKKAIAILLVLLVAGVAFGATPSLDLTATVNVKEGVLISLLDIASVEDFNTADDEVNDELDLESFDAEDGVTASSTFYLVLKTNKKLGTTIGLAGSALTTGVAADPKIGYTVATTTDGTYTKGTDLTVTNTATIAAKDSVAALGSFAAGNGMRVESAAATITLTQTDLDAASAGDYTATIVVNIATT